jgi:hypothetical protein
MNSRIGTSACMGISASRTAAVPVKHINATTMPVTSE